MDTYFSKHTSMKSTEHTERYLVSSHPYLLCQGRTFSLILFCFILFFFFSLQLLSLVFSISDRTTNVERGMNFKLSSRERNAIQFI